MTDRIYNVVNTIIHRHVFKMPVDIEKICRLYGAVFLSYTDAVGHAMVTKNQITHAAGTKDGFTLDAGSEWVIVYNDKVCENRKRFTFAEELMHRLLLHSQDEDFQYNRQSYTEETYQVYEDEAKRAAGMILVPPSVYYRFRQLYGHDQIARMCKVSEACVYTVAKFYDENEAEIREKFTMKQIECDRMGLVRKNPLRPKAVEGKSL